MTSIVSTGTEPRTARRYLRAPSPLFFPCEELVPETSVHMRLRTALFLILERELRGRAFVGSDQFLYWDPESYRCDALDAYWTFINDTTLGPMLRIAREPSGADLWLTPEEAERAALESARIEKEAALARIAELERQLRAKGP